LVQQHHGRNPVGSLAMRSLVQKVALCCVFISFAVWYARLHSYRDPGSIFFDKERTYEQGYLRRRKLEIKSLIDSFAGSKAPSSRDKAGKHPKHCVALSSVKRDHT